MKTPISFKIQLNQGFTLFELMIVVAIIAILSAVAIPAYNSYVTTARLEECALEATTIGLAEKQFFLENNRYFPAAGTSENSSIDYTAIEDASGGYFRSTYREHGAIGSNLYNAHVNCIFTVTTNADASNYSITVRGTGKLSGARELDTDNIMDKTVN